MDSYLSVLTPIGMEWASSAVICVLRNWQRSPCSRYSITTQYGSSRQQAPRTRAILRSSRAARILTSRWKSILNRSIGFTNSWLYYLRIFGLDDSIVRQNETSEFQFLFCILTCSFLR